jgi:sugar transferase (PEP-CTERM/EpsH1 system associated)
MQKLLIITSRIPYPLEKGDKLRMYHQLKYLSQHFQICLCALNDTQIHPQAKDELKKYCSELHFFSFNKLQLFLGILKSFFNGEPLQVGYFYHPSIQKKINETVKNFNPDFIYCQLLRTAKYALKYQQVKILDYMDALSKGTERRINYAPFWLKWVLKTETNRLKKFEASIFNSFNAHSIISEEDKKYISHPDKYSITVIPNGIDLDFFKPIDTEKKFDVVFTGNMSYPPNINAATFLVKKIQPLISQNIKVLISGAQPTKEVFSLQSNNCTVTGWIDDIRTSYASAKLFVAPLHIGTGLQNKILEAMAMKIPCITTSLVNASLGAKENEEILIAESPEQFAEKIAYLLHHTELANQMAEKAYLFVSKKYNWEKSTNQLVKLILNQKV